MKSGLLLVAAYVLIGKLALLLTMPSGYASPIFPPAGIAIAAAFIGGRRMLPWVFVGALILHLWMDFSLSMDVVVAALGIALASMLQAAAGGWVFRRVIGWPAAFDKGRDVLWFLLLGPAVCLISATLSVGVLTALGIMGVADSATGWLTWWLGDTHGLIITLPLVMTLAGQPRELWRKRRISVAVPALVIAPIVIFSGIRASEGEWQKNMLPYRLQSQQLADQLQTRLEIQEFLLKNVDSLLSHRTDKLVTRTEFSHFVKQSLDRFPVLQAVEWAPLVVHDQRAAFEIAQRDEFPGFEIRDKGTVGRMKRAAVRKSYYPVTYVEPVHSNQAAVGFDLTSTPERQQTLASAIQGDVPVATPPLRLVQENDHQSGILLVYRVSVGSHAPGVVLTVLRVGDFVDQTLPPQSRAVYEVSLTDTASQTLIYGELWPDYTRVAFEQTLRYGGREYLLRTKPSTVFVAQHSNIQGWFVLTLGLVGTELLVFLLLLSTGHTVRAEVLVSERTAALTLSEQEARKARDAAQAANLARSELALSEKDMREARNEAERANQAKSEFLASMSHELRTPMNAILGFGQVLEHDQQLNADQQDHVGEILKAGRHLLELIDGVLDLSKIESGHIDMSLEPVGVLPIVGECLGLVSTMADLRAIQLNHTGLMGAVVRADRMRLKQVLLNLLSNAIKYNREGGSVTIDAQPAGAQRIRIRVTDSGHGVSSEDLAQLFQPFNRLSAENSAVQGTGIGLTITRNIVELMGGEVGVKSEVGVGSCFWIELPLGTMTGAESKHDHVVATAANTHPAQHLDEASQLVLYIEDNPSNIKLVAQILDQRQHISLLTAHTPELGIELARSRRPVLILLDINLPGMDGYQVLEVFKADPLLRDIPVIAVTANAMPRDIERGQAAGFVDYLTKPLDVMHFITVVERLLA